MILVGNIEVTAFLPSEEALDSATESNFFWPIYIGFLLLTAAGVWRAFIKAGQRGWTCIIPFYNVIVLLKIVRKHPLWALAFCVPLVNAVVACYITIRLARLFGKGIGFGLGLVFLPFIYYPILGFGSAKYQAPGVVAENVCSPGEAPPASQPQYRKAG
jgi:hypothetical protein